MNVRKRIAALCVAAALLSVTLSACGTGPAGMCVHKIPPSQTEANLPDRTLMDEAPSEESTASLQEQPDDSEVIELEGLRPVLQNPDYPNGCEIASLAALLQYNGFNVTMDDLNETYLPKQDFSFSGRVIGPDPEEYYAGDPATSYGWYCFERPLADAANAYLADQDSELCAYILTGATMDELKVWLEKGVPVIVWFTADYSSPAYSNSFYWTLETGNLYIPYSNLHCLVLTAIKGDTCRFADPLVGITEVDSYTFERIYAQMGRRALVIVPADET